MTFDDVRKISLAWPEVEDGTCYGTPALKVRKKLLARLKEDGDSLVMPGVPQDEREMLAESPAETVLLHRSLPRLSDRADPPVQGQARGRRTVAAPAMAGAGVKGRGQGIRRRSVGWAKAHRRRAHRPGRSLSWWARFALPTLRTGGWTETNFSRPRCAIPPTGSSRANCSISRCRTLGSSPDAWCRPSGMY